jgi:hypothetical protein
MYIIDVILIKIMQMRMIPVRTWVVKENTSLEEDDMFRFYS